MRALTLKEEATQSTPSQPHRQAPGGPRSPLMSPVLAIKYIVLSLRPKQWIKNLFVFAAPFFAVKLLSWSALLPCLLAFVAFCMVSGAVYLINDILDREQDRVHPKKRFRPLAAGHLGPATAWGAALALYATFITMGLYLNLTFGLILAAYGLLNLVYSLWLKHVVVLDVFIIAVGFVLRVIGGAEVISVSVSSWLLTCTIFISLFLALCKRRHELVLLDANSENHRKILKEYNTRFLDQMISVVTGLTVMSYALYTMDAGTVERFGTAKLIYTVPFVLYGVFRYLFLVHNKEQGGSPARVLLTDVPLIVNIVLYALTAFLMIYL